MYFIHSHFLGRPLGHYPRPPPYPRSVLVHLFLGGGRIHVLLILIFFHGHIMSSLSAFSSKSLMPLLQHLAYHIVQCTWSFQCTWSLSFQKKASPCFLTGPDLLRVDLTIGIISRILLFVLQPFHNLEYPSDPWIVFWKISSFTTEADLLWQ